VKYTLLTATLIASTFLPWHSAVAQDREVLNRLNRLENEIQTLNEAYFRGGAKAPVSQGIKSQSNQVESTINHISPSQTAQMDARLSAMEQTLRELTGKIEEQGYQSRQMQAKFESYIADSNLRFQDLEGKITAGEAAQNTRNNTKAMKTLEIANPKPDAMTLGQMKKPQNETVATANAENALPSDDENAAYEQAFSLLRQGQYEEAEGAFLSFLEAYKNSDLAGNAQYWLAETHYVRGEYADAARAFAKGYKTYPDSPKKADNLLKLSLSLASLEQTEEACITLKQLETEVPDAPAPIKHRAEQESVTLGCNS
tara:strand:- start:192 stop:1133 length:942 start_codon:yes stop_codon:yes gene_type:complete